MTNDKTGTMYLTTSSAIALFKGEIKGQLSDGMWENTRPDDHWHFWQDLNVVLGHENIVVANPQAWRNRCRKNNYALTKLIPIIGDRMVKIGQMGQHTTDDQAIRAGEYMPETFVEWQTCKVADRWRYDFIADYMKSVNEELARAFYAFKDTYGVKELKADLGRIKEAMKSTPTDR
jgi:hypothetical protein